MYQCGLFEEFQYTTYSSPLGLSASDPVVWVFSYFGIFNLHDEIILYQLPVLRKYYACNITVVTGISYLLFLNFFGI